MQLTEEQQKQVTAWIDAGAKLSEIQDRIDKEFGIRLTYMDVRLLVDDLKLTPKDAESANPPTPPEAAAPEMESVPENATEAAAEPEPGLIGGKVSVSVDHLARPGAMVSGKVTFSDGQKAEWYMDQYGRLGLSPSTPGYRPPQGDIPVFQAALEQELAKMGL
jgi:hypothetical protein